MRFKRVYTLSLLISAFSASSAWSLDIRTSLDSNGAPIFQTRIFDVTDGAYSLNYYGEPNFSAWNLNAMEKDQVLAAVDYWSELIQVVPGQNPAIINVGTMNDGVASALSPLSSDQEGAGTQVFAAINNQRPGELTLDAHGIINIGKQEWAKGAYQPSQITLSPTINLTTVSIHEVAHALGVSSDIYYLSSPSDPDKPILLMPQELSKWDEHLYDDNHQRAQAGQVVYCTLCDNVTHDDAGNPIPTEDIFDARQDKVYFGGTHVSDVLAGAMPGVPLTLYRNGEFDIPAWSHLEMKNGLMSHQSYRNYTNLMEVEVAVLQDLGYQIDRRNFWGSSVYGNDQNMVNDNPFFARNQDQTAYVPNTYNMATLGLGLHVYGSNNIISQRADLLSAGAGGGGIRIDGQGNQLTILPGTRVHANGAYGRGVMVAYGKDHTFTHRGDIEALGEHGIAASFDFGFNAAGNIGTYLAYRGSYIQTEQGVNVPLSDELNGPLVKTVDLTGRLAGSYASIYASTNAYVGQINVMDKAQLTGDIISLYDQVDDNNQQRLTKLAFGYRADADGRSTGAADSNFAFAYDGNIVGLNNLSLELVGGTTQLTGNHELYQAAVAQGATLVSSGNYKLHQAGSFINQGKVTVPTSGQSLTVDGAYVQAPSGQLALSFNDQRNISNLVVKGNATIDGAISFTPERGYYGDDFTIQSNHWVQADALTGSFNALTTPTDSPTLTVTARSMGPNTYNVAVARSQRAYSQYGTTSNERAVGIALSSVAGRAPSSIQGLVTALDFSTPDGTSITTALPQFTGEAYASAKSVLINTSSTTRTAVFSRLQQAFGSEASSSTILTKPQPQQSNVSGPTAWGYGFGSWANLNGNGNAAKTQSDTNGFITGIDVPVQDSWRLGMLAGYSHSSIKVKDRSSSGSSDNYTLGAYLGKEWPMAANALAFRSGLSYTWHKMDMDRRVAFSGFNDKLSSDNDAGTFQIFGELGYRAAITESASIEPYANLAHVNLRTDRFTEQDQHGAGLKVNSDTMNTTFSTLGARASTEFGLGTILATARLDLGWRHAFGDTLPYSTASLAGSNPFTVSGSPVGKDTAIVEAGLGFQVSKHTTLGVAYQGQFGSGMSQNAVNLNVSARF